MSDLKPTLIALNVAMPILATTVVLLRLQARRLSNAFLGIDDYLVVAALVSRSKSDMRRILILSSFSRYVSRLTLSLVSKAQQRSMIMYAAHITLAVRLGNLGGHLRLNPDGSPEDFDQLVLFQKVCCPTLALSSSTCGWLSD